MLNDLSPTTHASDPIHQLDKPATIGRIEQLALLPHDWNGYGAYPIDSKVIESASRFIDLLPPDAISTPQVVPMTGGRLQFEWHRGNRSLELEFETPTLIHYLKYDPDREIEEEATLPVDETTRLMELLHWFHED
jgi:hypothetical protein